MPRIFALCLALTTALAQDAAPHSNQTQKTTPKNTIRVSVNLVQVDAVVTDSKGKQVTDLKAEDFEVLQDGKPQIITRLSYITTSPGSVPSGPSSLATQGKGVPLPPPSKLRLTDVRRTIALVVDDLGLSFESTVYVRQALKKFIDGQMQPGDLVAIVRTGAGIGALQQFTTDKRLLHAAADRVRFNPFGRRGVGSFAPVEPSLPAQGSNPRGVDTAEFDEARQQAFTVGTLGAITYVVSGLRELPGRKSVVLFSESMQILYGGGMDPLVLEGLQRLTDAADRASVVIYGIDPRGVQTYQLTAADSTSEMSAQEISQVPMDRSTQAFNSNQGMEILTSQTGGLFIHSDNDIDGALRRVIDDSGSYYLIGYRPDPSTFDRKTGRPQFHRLQVRMKRPHLRVRSRSGFFGMSDDEQQLSGHAGEGQLKRAIFSPFDSGSIHVRLTALFGIVPKLGPVLDYMLYIDARDVKFTNEPDGSHKTAFDLLAITFGDNGQAVDADARRFTLQMKDDGYQRTLRDGLIYVRHHPIKKPGAYQLRIALQDTASQEIGSASQFIEVPDLRKDRLTLSSLLLIEDAPKLAMPTQGQSEEQVDRDPSRSAATRTFKPGAALTYTYQVLNARMNSSHQPNLEVQSRLFREGQQIFSSDRVALNITGQTDFKRLIAGGTVHLGSKMLPGDYVLQLIVTDKLAKQKYGVVSQSVDFEVQP
ncbi:MAG TPA: VWA domain-containing protein [Terriglobales bacterium]|nr:VWA domain-containing protein [Terriglobales bacterium]